MMNAAGRDIRDEILQITGKERFQGSFCKDGKILTKSGASIASTRQDLAFEDSRRAWTF